MKFFTREDIDFVYSDGKPLTEPFLIALLDRLNTKLERKGKVIYFESDGILIDEDTIGFRHLRGDTHHALLINIEPINECVHEKYERKSSIKWGESWYYCPICGIDLKPLTFGPA